MHRSGWLCGCYFCGPSSTQVSPEQRKPERAGRAPFAGPAPWDYTSAGVRSSTFSSCVSLSASWRMSSSLRSRAGSGASTGGVQKSTVRSGLRPGSRSGWCRWRTAAWPPGSRASHMPTRRSRRNRCTGPEAARVLDAHNPGRSLGPSGSRLRRLRPPLVPRPR